MNVTYHPRSVFQLLWHRFGFLLAVIHAFITPLQLAFLYDNLAFWWFSRSLDVIGLIAIYLGFHMAFFNREGVLVSHPLITAERYVFSRFLIDLLGSFPFDIFYNGWYRDDADVLHASAFIRLIRLISFYKIPITFYYLESHQETATDYIRITKFVLYIAVFMNMLTCGFFTMACPPFSVFDWRPDSSQLFTIADFECLADSWISSTPMTSSSTNVFELYTVSFYFASATSVSVG